MNNRISTNRIKVLNCLTKAEEIQLMYSFYDALPQDSYLKMMLAGFPEFAEMEIKHDFGRNPLDIIREYQEKAETLEQGNVEMQNVIRNLTWKFSNLEREYKNRGEYVERLITDKQLKLGYIESLERELEKKEEEIIRLKVKSFDLIMKE